MRRLTVVARVWGFHRLAAGALTMVAIWRLLPNPFHVPGRGADVSWVLAPLVPTVLAVLVPATAEVAYRDQERLTGQSVWIRRATAVLVVTLLGLTASILGATDGRWGEFARNTMLLVGTGFLATWLLPRSLRWLPVLGLAIASWLIGATPPWQAPADWAVLLHDRSSATAMTVALSLYVGGAGIYISRSTPLFR